MKNNGKPLVSVILCFYNEERFLREAIDSVVAQDYDSWELLLVDDGSSDGSPDIARQYEQRYPDRVQCLSHAGHANKGLSASRNLGICYAQGEYVAFLDADDVWLPSKLSSQMRIFRENPKVTVIVESSNYWRSWSGAGEQDVEIPVGASEGVYIPPTLATCLYPLGKGAAPCPSGIIVHYLVLKRCNFEESFRGIYQMYEDQAFLCKVYLKETVYVSRQCNNKYRQRPASLVSSVHSSGKYDLVRGHYLRWFREYLSHQPVEHAVVSDILDRALMKYEQPLLHKLRVELPRYVKDVAARALVKLGVLSYRKTW